MHPLYKDCHVGRLLWPNTALSSLSCGAELGGHAMGNLCSSANRKWAWRVGDGPGRHTPPCPDCLQWEAERVTDKLRPQKGKCSPLDTRERRPQSTGCWSSFRQAIKSLCKRREGKEREREVRERGEGRREGQTTKKEEEKVPRSRLAQNINVWKMSCCDLRRQGTPKG